MFSDCLFRLRDGNGDRNGGAHHRVVAHADETHHLDVRRNGRRARELRVGVHTAHRIGHAVGRGARRHVVRMQGAARAAAARHGEVLLAVLDAPFFIGARNGVLEQTLRHTYIAYLLKIPHVVFCINKMDLIGYSEERYESIKTELEKLALKLELDDARFIPISAKYGDNVVERSTNMDWYSGTTLLNLLETIEIKRDFDMADGRFPVQYVIRPQKKDYIDYRGYAGRIASGVFKPGDNVVALPSGITTKIEAIDFYGEELDEAVKSQSVTIRLTDDIDLSRGGMIVPEGKEPIISNTFAADMCWFNEKPLEMTKKYILRHTANEQKCAVKVINYKTNINTYEKDHADKKIGMNDIFNVTLVTAKPLFCDSYKNNRTTGSVILIDEGTNETVAAGMIN